jgi:hypothetical protein
MITKADNLFRAEAGKLGLAFSSEVEYLYWTTPYLSPDFVPLHYFKFFLRERARDNVRTEGKFGSIHVHPEPEMSLYVRPERERIRKLLKLAERIFDGTQSFGYEQFAKLNIPGFALDAFMDDPNARKAVWSSEYYTGPGPNPILNLIDWVKQSN